ncbi:MAG: hypothetical protein Q4G03_11165, partial [Planctomycetia bacterium]|nr:hypothetical protein [Planctomycetia bacterium]
GDSQNVFIGNHERNLSQDDPGVTERDGAFLTDVHALKRWLEKTSGLSLREIGLRTNWGDANEPVVEQYVRQFSE